MEIGLYTFAELSPDPQTGQAITPQKRVRDLMALVVGSPQEVVEKILFQHELFGHQRFLAQISVGHLPHANAMRAIELLGTEVVPAVRTELQRRAPSARGAVEARAAR